MDAQMHVPELRDPPSAIGLNIVYYFAWVAIKKDQKLGNLNHRNLLSHSSGGSKSEVKAWQSWLPLRPMREESVLGLSPQTLINQLLVHLIFSLFVWAHISLSYKDSHIGLGPP